MALPADLRPAPDRLGFVTVGDPTGAQGILRDAAVQGPATGSDPVRAPETPYDTVVVNGEYDGWADFPDRPWNLVSLVNALLGIAYVHGGYETIPGGLDLSTVPPANITTSTNSLGGTTTVYLIPTERLPLVQPLRDIGVPEPVVAALEAPLKAMVDAGYVRNDPRSRPSPRSRVPRGRGQQIGGRNGRGFGQLRASAASPGRDQSRKSARQGRGRAAA